MTARLIECDVAVIGSGPSGLAAATRLKQLGVQRVIVLEREAEAGGVPRHCGHPPFGMRELNRITTGPGYARALASRAVQAGVEICTKATVIALHPDARLSFTDHDGPGEIQATRVVIATGIRETPRSARLVSGNRPRGILTTGALQSMIYLTGKAPCQRPLIAGTELVAFSAILTCRHAGIRPVAMVEENPQISARPFATLLPRLKGIPVFLNSRIGRLEGIDQIEGVQLLSAHVTERHIDCDSVIFTGQFVPESSLCLQGSIEIDPATGGPVVDQFGRCSDPSYYATGNLLRAVETAGWCWREGMQVAQQVCNGMSKVLSGQSRKIRIVPKSPVISYVVPQHIAPADCDTQLQLRFAVAAKGVVKLLDGDKIIASRNIRSKPHRRITLPVRFNATMLHSSTSNLSLAFEADE